MTLTTGSNRGLLFRPEFINPEETTGLWWCQDAEDMQAIAVNAVCKSAVARWHDLNDWADWIGKFPFILVAVPPGETQEEISQELVARFPVPVMVPEPEVFRGFGTVRELVEDGGQRALDRLLLEAVELPDQNVLNMAEIDTAKKLNAKRVVSGIPGLDREIGGFSGGQLSVWTGRRGEGKSTLLGQIMLDAVNQNHTVCVYSGELAKEDFKLSLLQQAAGYLHVTRREESKSGKVLFDVDPDVIPAIDRWWDKRLFLTDIQRKNAHDEDNILKIFEYANRRYGCDIFLVDNVMTAELKHEEKIGTWRAQSLFTGRLVAFAKRLNVHVHLVAHPRKTDGKIEADDVGGSVDITNRADNVFKIERVPEEEIQKAGYSTLLTVLKNREFGTQARVRLDYNEPSRRLYEAGKSPAKRYSWEALR